MITVGDIFCELRQHNEEDERAARDIWKTSLKRFFETNHKISNCLPLWDEIFLALAEELYDR